jgi:hypothetical protein
MGTAGIPPRDILVDAFHQVMTHAAKADLHIDTETIPLTHIEHAWQRDRPGRRLVIMI